MREKWMVGPEFEISVSSMGDVWQLRLPLEMLACGGRLCLKKGTVRPRR